MFTDPYNLFQGKDSNLHSMFALTLMSFELNSFHHSSKFPDLEKMSLNFYSSVVTVKCFE